MNSGDMAQANVIARGVSQALKSTPIKVEIIIPESPEKPENVDDAINIIRSYCENRRNCIGCAFFNVEQHACRFNCCPNMWRNVGI